jgi:hypothetical protein
METFRYCAGEAGTTDLMPMPIIEDAITKFRNIAKWTIPPAELGQIYLFMLPAGSCWLLLYPEPSSNWRVFLLVGNIVWNLPAIMLLARFLGDDAHIESTTPDVESGTRVGNEADANTGDVGGTIELSQLERNPNRYVQQATDGMDVISLSESGSSRSSGISNTRPMETSTHAISLGGSHPRTHLETTATSLPSHVLSATEEEPRSLLWNFMDFDTSFILLIILVTMSVIMLPLDIIYMWNHNDAKVTFFFPSLLAVYTGIPSYLLLLLVLFKCLRRHQALLKSTGTYGQSISYGFYLFVFPINILVSLFLYYNLIYDSKTTWQPNWANRLP